jgi:hypothetical protein
VKVPEAIGSLAGEELWWAMGNGDGQNRFSRRGDHLDGARCVNHAMDARIMKQTGFPDREFDYCIIMITIVLQSSAITYRTHYNHNIIVILRSITDLIII